jgi:adenylate kinase family enzyme
VCIRTVTNINVDYTWEMLLKAFSNRWIIKMKSDDMHKIKEALKKFKKELVEKDDQFSNMQSLIQTLIKVV